MGANVRLTSGSRGTKSQFGVDGPRAVNEGHPLFIFPHWKPISTHIRCPRVPCVIQKSHLRLGFLEADSETRRLTCRKFDGEPSPEQLSGREGSRTRQQAKLNCKVITTEVSANLTGNPGAETALRGCSKFRQEGVLFPVPGHELRPGGQS